MPKKSKPKPRTNWKQRAEFYEASADKRANHILWLDKRLITLEERAKHAEEVIGVQNQLAVAREAKLADVELRATAAENHCTFLLSRLNADMALDWEKNWSGKLDSLGEKLNPVKIPDTPHWIWREGQGYVLEKSGLPYEPPYQACADSYEPKPNPTHWQRFKSWLAEYGYELFGGAVLLCVLAGLGALLYWNR